MDEQRQGGPAGIAADSPPDLVGQVLAGRYRILQKLGEGAMGAVYLGEHLRMGRRDAIKVLRGPLAGDAEAIRRFNRGARNVSAVRHPNVCTIYDFSDTAEGVTFLAMELITGESLRELIEREGALAPARAVAIACQVARALQAAHDAGIVHRDLKPANIMLMRDRDGADLVKVVDFDIAKGYDEVEGVEVTRVGFVVGTPEYMSPEQLMGERLDGRSDLYSLGLVLFRMVSGTLPFRADSTQELMIQRLTRKPLRLDEAAPGRVFPPGLQEILDRALATKPSERQACAEDFARELEQALGSAGTRPVPQAPPSAAPTASPAPLVAGTAPLAPTLVATAAGPPPSSPAAQRRTGSHAVLFAAAAAVLVIGAGTAWWMKGRPSGPADATAAPASAATGAPAVAPQPSAAVPVSEPAAGTGAVPPRAAAPEPPGRSGAGAAAGRDGAAPGAVDPAPATPTPPAKAPPPAPASDATALLWRQYDRLGPPYPAPAVVQAIRDTAQAVWDRKSASDEQRALAAFILANVQIANGAGPEVAAWAQRAVDLDPRKQGYRTLLNQYRQPSQ